MNIAALSAQNVVRLDASHSEALTFAWCKSTSSPGAAYRATGFPSMTNTLEMFVCGHVVFNEGVSTILTGGPRQFNY